MSHSQFRRVKTYTETCMDESLRQAYDYWQDQPGLFITTGLNTGMTIKPNQTCLFQWFIA